MASKFTLLGIGLHPGFILGEGIIPESGMKKTQIAEALGIHRSTLYELMAGKVTIDADLAVKLQRLFKVPDWYWLGLQADYDLKLARARAADLAPPAATAIAA